MSDDNIYEVTEHAQPGRRYGQCACNPGCGQPGACRSSAPISAMDATLSRIRREFSRSIANHQVRCAIKLGTGHPEVRARYDAILARPTLRRLGLESAIHYVEGAFLAERKAFQLAHTFGVAHPRRPLEILRELRLILRFVRRFEYRPHYRAIVMLVAS